MFNSNPSAFYMFEPLDALYSALYGTSQGWNVPSDITAFGNGSQRSVVARTLHLACSLLIVRFRKRLCNTNMIILFVSCDKNNIIVK